MLGFRELIFHLFDCSYSWNLSLTYHKVWQVSMWMMFSIMMRSESFLKLTELINNFQNSFFKKEKWKTSETSKIHKSQQMHVRKIMFSSNKRMTMGVGVGGVGVCVFVLFVFFCGFVVCCSVVCCLCCLCCLLFVLRVSWSLFVVCSQLFVLCCFIIVLAHWSYVFWLKREVSGSSFFFDFVEIFFF